MDRATRIRALIEEALSPERIDLEDDSAKHVGHAGWRPGGETHYRLTVVARAFEGRSRTERHRMIYAALSGELADGLHALELSALAPGEAGG